MGKWYERNEVKRVNMDWVKTNCKLTARELELLPLIYERRLVRRDHLEIISPSYRGLGDNRTVILNRSLTKMFQQMVIDKVHEKQEIKKGNFPAIVSLDKAGSLIIGEEHKKRIIYDVSEHAGIEYINRRLPINYYHIQCVNQLEVDTILFCEKYNFNILFWSLEKPKSFMLNGEEIMLIPDVLTIINVKGKNIALFIEYDTGSESLRMKKPKVLADKFQRYKDYLKSEVWLKDRWQKHFNNPIFPLIVFISEKQQRVKYVKTLSSELELKIVPAYHTDYTKVLKFIISQMKVK